MIFYDVGALIPIWGCKSQSGCRQHQKGTKKRQPQTQILGIIDLKANSFIYPCKAAAWNLVAQPFVVLKAQISPCFCALVNALPPPFGRQSQQMIRVVTWLPPNESQIVITAKGAPIASHTFASCLAFTSPEGFENCCLICLVLRAALIHIPPLTSKVAYTSTRRLTSLLSLEQTAGNLFILVEVRSTGVHVVQVLASMSSQWGKCERGIPAAKAVTGHALALAKAGTKRHGTAFVHHTSGTNQVHQHAAAHRAQHVWGSRNHQDWGDCAFNLHNCSWAKLLLVKESWCILVLSLLRHQHVHNVTIKDAIWDQWSEVQKQSDLRKQAPKESLRHKAYLVPCSRVQRIPLHPFTSIVSSLLGRSTVIESKESRWNMMKYHENIMKMMISWIRWIQDIQHTTRYTCDSEDSATEAKANMDHMGQVQLDAAGLVWGLAGFHWATSNWAWPLAGTQPGMTGMTGMWAEGHDKAGRISHHSLPLPFPSGNKKIDFKKKTISTFEARRHHLTSGS